MLHSIQNYFLFSKLYKYIKKMPPVMNGIVPPLVQKQEITTVFVGNITDKASDTLIRQILMKCGYIVSWKRVQGAAGRLQAFGFCEYSDPEAGLRSMRLLSGFQIGDKKLLVKVDSKTRSQLDRYKEQKKIEKEVLCDSGENLDDYDIEYDEETKKQDDGIRKEIEKLIRDNMSELDSGILQTFKKTHSGNAENLEGLDMNDDTKNLVAKEIRGFRETYKDERKERDKERERSREKDRHRDRSKEREREYEREKEKQREKEREREREKEREREREREREKRKREREREEREERESRSKHEEAEAPIRSSRRSKSRSRERDRGGIEDNDEEYERRRMERIRKDKEHAFLEKLKEWEIRERKRARDYEKQSTKEERKRTEEEEERAHLLEFLEDYDDDRDDVKYYKGSALSRRMRDRDLEIQADARDKQREMEEIEEVLKKQLAGEPIETKKKRGNDPEKTSIQQELMEIERQQQPVAPPVQQNPNLRPAFTAINEETPDTSPAQQDTNSPSPMSSPSFTKFKLTPESKGATPSLKREHSEVNGSNEPVSKKFGFGMKVASNVANKNKLGTVFNVNEDVQGANEEPKKKLSRLDEDPKKEPPTVDDKRKLIKNLIEKIPTVKEDLFLYPLKWEIVDETLVEKRIKPWVNKKIFEYIGEEEQTLVEFICSKVLSKSSAKNILEDVAMVLDEESEVFVVKMWRLLIYETEAKCLGLVK
ncbi:RNA-binding protein 25 isoform X2 [Hydra vulgaris]|uniref:RNA-binding protein 25 isoform X2 n=2 Tax=Hydra vulgaris TaxID=6087 RepID=A0ABM4CG13_HYDVU